MLKIDKLLEEYKRQSSGIGRTLIYKDIMKYLKHMRQMRQITFKELESIVNYKEKIIKLRFQSDSIFFTEIELENLKDYIYKKSLGGVIK